MYLPGRVFLFLCCAAFVLKADDRVYEPGGDVTAPKLIHYVEPDYTPSAKEAYVEGTVRIATIVTIDGMASESRVLSGLTAEEDRAALEALKHWKFAPGTKSGTPVKVKMTIQIDFHLL